MKDTKQRKLHETNMENGDTKEFGKKKQREL